MSGMLEKSGISKAHQEPVDTHLQNVLAGSDEGFQSPISRFIRPPVRRARVRRGLDDLDGQALTGRESDILLQLGKGLSVKGIARVFDISPGTVKWHIKNLYKKLEVGSREDALSKARQQGLIPR